MSDRSVRTAILSRIHAALGERETEAERVAQVERHLKAHSRGTVPARAAQEPEALIAYFRHMLESTGAETCRVESKDEIVETIADYLRKCDVAPRLRVGSDPLLESLPWSEAVGVALEKGAAQPSDAATLSRAVACAAETGTLFLVSGSANPTTLNFLPENHIVLIRAADVVGAYEDAWDRIRGLYGKRLPRMVNLVSGPSRTADIEQTIIRGAHGPKRLFVLIFG